MSGKCQSCENIMLCKLHWLITNESSDSNPTVLLNKLLQTRFISQTLYQTSFKYPCPDQGPGSSKLP